VYKLIIRESAELCPLTNDESACQEESESHRLRVSRWSKCRAAQSRVRGNRAINLEPWCRATAAPGVLLIRHTIRQPQRPDLASPSSGIETFRAPPLMRRQDDSRAVYRVYSNSIPACAK